MKRVAILGGGPAGAFAAERLARAGLNPILVDEKLAWEKPCGGGLTYKAYSQYPFLLDNNTPKKIIRRTCLSSETGGTASLQLERPLVIYSRLDLNSLLLRRAECAGATLEKTRVTGLERRGDGWRVQTKSGGIDADFCLVAMGARNPIREVGTEWAAGDTMSSLGYYVPGTQEQVDLQFFPGFEGYIWIFPRDGHLSAGIAGKGRTAQEMRSMLDRYLQERGISTAGASFFGHVIPSLERPRWRSNRVSGEGWMALGDAAGLVDPVTGEGLYYALRSADIAAGMLLEHGSGRAPEQYGSVVSREMLADLETGARMAKRFFGGRFLHGDVTGRMIQMVRWSPTLRQVVQDLFAGTQQYVDLKPRLKAQIFRTTLDVATGWAESMLLPSRFRASGTSV